MKQLAFVTALFLAIFVQAQVPVLLPQPSVEVLSMYPIQVTVNMTANLVFPYEVKSVDRGTEDLLVQKAPGAGHILQVKAGSTQMPETNLSVITADMHLYSFQVRFDSFPKTLNYRFTVLNRPLFVVNQSSGIHQLNDAQIKQDAAQAAGYKPFGKQVQASHYGTTLKLNGIYIHENVLYFSMQMENETPINYDIESLRLFLRDRKGNKRTAQQEISIFPLYSYGNDALIEANSSQRLVIAVPKFTIPDQKNCIIQLREGGGGRHLEFKISNKVLIRCKSLTD